MQELHAKATPLRRKRWLKPANALLSQWPRRTSQRERRSPLKTRLLLAKAFQRYQFAKAFQILSARARKTAFGYAYPSQKG